MKSVAGRSGRRGPVMAFAAIVLAGCGSGDSGGIPAVPAAGTITYDGKPVEKGTIQFLPEKGHQATGAIEGGKFTLSTYKDGDGAIPGKHGVGVSVTQDVPTKDGDTTVKYLVPQKYADPGEFLKIVPSRSPPAARRTSSSTSPSDAPGRPGAGPTPGRRSRPKRRCVDR